METNSHLVEENFIQIITFYSYKGGVGRTMALANAAVLLARRIRASKNHEARVLMIDWDVEAPGLHRFFANQIEEKDSLSRPGLIELISQLEKNFEKFEYPDEETQELVIYETLQKLDFDLYTLATGVEGLFLLKAGLFDENYGPRVNSFRWDEFHRRNPAFFRIFSSWLAESFQYVLIDSRTGLTDVSGICTTLMPEKLVVVFTPNRQSLTGLREFVQRATSYRTNSSDLRPLIVYPLPSRIEASLERLRSDWRYGNEEKGIEGYEKLFTEILSQAYALKRCDLQNYFEEVQIQQTPEYAYGEDIAVLTEVGSDVFSLSTSFERFTKWLVDRDAPWIIRKEDKYEKENWIKKSNLLAERAYEQLSTSEREVAKQMLFRMVSVNKNDGELQIFARPVAKPVLLSLRSDAEGILEILERSRIIYVEHRKNLEPIVRLSDDDLIQNWPRLKKIVEKNLELIIELQQLEKSADDWRKHEKFQDLLLKGIHLANAKQLSSEILLSKLEEEFIETSQKKAHDRKFRYFLFLTIFCILSISFILVMLFLINRNP